MVLPDISGSDLLSEIKKRSPRTHVIIMTGFATIGSAEDLIKRGASDYISKPWEVNDLLVSLGNILEEKKFDTEQHTDDFDFILGCLSNPIRRKIIAVLCEEKMKNLMGITRRLQIEDHSKVVFHLRVLKESGMVKQDRNKSYRLTRKGEKTLDCLKMLESQIME